MNNDQLLEGNKLIAEFMGADIDKYHCSVIDFYKDDSGKTVSNFVFGKAYFDEGTAPLRQATVDCLKYHKSWDWLMPVVEKIEKLKGIRVIIDTGLSCEVFYFGKRIKKVIGENKIETVWLTCVEFIKWHNQTQTTTNATKLD